MTPLVEGVFDITNYLVEEQIINSFFKIVKIEYGDKRVYSIDFYKLLSNKPSCMQKLSNGEVQLCYVELGRDCIGVILVSKTRIELINLRLITYKHDDPVKGSLIDARRHCIEEVEKWIKS